MTVNDLLEQPMTKEATGLPTRQAIGRNLVPGVGALTGPGRNLVPGVGALTGPGRNLVPGVGAALTSPGRNLVPAWDGGALYNRLKTQKAPGAEVPDAGQGNSYQPPSLVQGQGFIRRNAVAPFRMVRNNIDRIGNNIAKDMSNYARNLYHRYW